MCPPLTGIDAVVSAGSTVSARLVWVHAGEPADEDLVTLARGGDDQALRSLLVRYQGFARRKAAPYFLAGADREDIVQEGLIGLYKAIRDYNPSLRTPFRSFAELCVTRQVISAVKAAARLKRSPLNAYVSILAPQDAQDEAPALADLLPSTSAVDPADLVISAERIAALQRHCDDVLSDLEAEVLRQHVDGRSQQEIAESLQRQVKSVDNALQRIKRKLADHLRDRAIADVG
ncbi:MAG: RNA polymerase sporulation sigma factor SigH [Mycobacteriales bacterium]